jgi:hypothetical protein
METVKYYDNCPNCGAAYIDGSNLGKCGYCGTLVKAVVVPQIKPKENESSDFYFTKHSRRPVSLWIILGMVFGCCIGAIVYLFIKRIRKKKEQLVIA